MVGFGIGGKAARWTGAVAACAALVACASGQGKGTDAVGSAELASASASMDPAGHGPGGTSLETGGGAPVDTPRGPGPGGTDARVPLASATPTSIGSSSPSSSGSAGPAAGPPTTFEIRSACPDSLEVFVGDKPKASIGVTVTVRPGAPETAKRAADGTQTVWLVNGKGEGIASGRVLATGKRAIIGSNCRSIQVE